MKKLFGAKKKEEPKPEVASLQDTTAKVSKSFIFILLFQIPGPLFEHIYHKQLFCIFYTDAPSIEEKCHSDIYHRPSFSPLCQKY